MAKIEPHFNDRFLSVKKYAKGKVVQEPYHEIISRFQFYVGLSLLILSLIALLNTTLRFIEITDYDRAQFSINQNKVKREGR